MATKTFSELLAELQAGAAPSAEWVEEVLAALRPLLATELRRRSLWTTAPRYLGVEAERWPEGLSELALDAYSFIFVDRLSALCAQLKVRPNIDGLVLLNVRHFLHQRQLENDRLGYQVFDVVRDALAERIAGRELTVLAGSSEIRNDTLLSFVPEVDAEPAPRELLADLARTWNDVLLPDLISAHGAGRVEVLARLRSLIAELPERGFLAFLVGDLIAPLKADLRRRWTAVLEQEGAVEEGPEGGLPLVFPFAKPEDLRRSLEARDQYEKLVNCVQKKIEIAPEEGSLRRQLEWVWGSIRAWIDDATAPVSPPSVRGLAELFGLSRKRVSELYDQLRHFVRTCLEILAGRVAEIRTRRATP